MLLNAKDSKITVALNTSMLSNCARRYTTDDVSLQNRLITDYYHKRNYN